MINLKFEVCAVCMTYNQAPYIVDTMNGFTMQKTQFPFVCCIVDDNSTDGTNNVIEEYVNSHFSFEIEGAYRKETDYAKILFARHKENNNCWFATLFLKENHYSKNKSKEPYLVEWKDKSKYCAVCEGDDYWIDCNKLQNQASLLENNKTCNLVYSRVFVYKQAQKKIAGVHGRKRTNLKERLLKGCFISTCTVMFKVEDEKAYYNEIDPFSKDWKMGDIPFFLFLGYRGNGIMQKEITAIYRVLDESASHSKDVSRVVSQSESTRDVFLFFANKYYPNDNYISERIKAAHLYRVFRAYSIDELPEIYKKEIIETEDDSFKTKIAKFVVKHPQSMLIYDKIVSLKQSLVLAFVKK